MEKILNLTKGILSIVGIAILTILSVVTITSLNPVSKLVLTSEERNIAGIQNFRDASNQIFFKEASKDIKLTNTSAEFDVLPGVTTFLAGEVVFNNPEQIDTFAKVSVEMASSLDKVLRVELIDEYNKIILSDFYKSFDSQSITFKANESRKFSVRYKLSEPLNYTTKARIILK